MDILPNGNIFLELQDIHDTGYFPASASLEDHWQQVSRKNGIYLNSIFWFFHSHKIDHHLSNIYNKFNGKI